MSSVRFLNALLIFSFLFSCSYLPLIKEDELKLLPEEIPDAEMIQELNGILAGVSYSRKYEINVFDCSNETAYMYDFLTSKGYECEIILGAESIRRMIFGGELGRGHAWIIAKKHGKKFWVEPTAKTVYAASSYDIYFWKLRFRSLEKLKKFWKFWNLPDGEWNY